MHIICYTGGTCGDIVTAVIDSRDIKLEQNRVHMPAERSKFKKPHLFVSEQDKDIYIDYMSRQYCSLPSHDLEYHTQHRHDIIGISVQDRTVAFWAADRFKSMHRPQVWQEMTAFCGATTVDEYAEMLIHNGNLLQTKTQKILRLESILAGNLITALTTLLGSSDGLDFSLYQQWLVAQNQM